MKTSLLPCLAAAAALTLLSSGCRTYQPDTEGEAYYPAEVSPASVSDANAVAPEVVVPSAADVGKEGTYKEFVIPAEGGDQSYAIESEGLAGQTGRHVSLPPPVQEPAPAPAVRSVSAAPASGNVYVVQDGDILGRIAIKYGTTVKALMDANGIKDAKKLRVGQKLTIPAATAKPASTAKPVAKAKDLPAKAGYTTYLVKDGDILGRIANKNGTTVKALMEANGLTDPAKLRAGKYIYVPAAGAAKASAPAVDLKPALPRPAAPVVEEDDVEEVVPAETAAPVSLDDLLK